MKTYLFNNVLINIFIFVPFIFGQIISNDCGVYNAMASLKVSDCCALSIVECVGNRITKLTLKYDNVASIPPSIGELTELEELDLSMNHIEYLPNELFKLEKLKVINLGNNYLKNIPASIGELKSLEVLNLRGNNLKSLPNEIFKLEKLNLFDIGDNKLLKTKLINFGNGNHTIENCYFNNENIECYQPNTCIHANYIKCEKECNTFDINVNKLTQCSFKESSNTKIESSYSCKKNVAIILLVILIISIIIFFIVRYKKQQLNNNKYIIQNSFSSDDSLYKVDVDDCKKDEQKTELNNVKNNSANIFSVNAALNNTKDYNHLNLNNYNSNNNSNYNKINYNKPDYNTINNYSNNNCSNNNNDSFIRQSTMLANGVPISPIISNGVPLSPIFPNYVQQIPVTISNNYDNIHSEKQLNNNDIQQNNNDIQQINNDQYSPNYKNAIKKDSVHIQNNINSLNNMIYYYNNQLNNYMTSTIKKQEQDRNNYFHGTIPFK